jgi:hypothetical protein
VNVNFAKLCRRTGGYKLAWLITISDPDDTTIVRVVNNNADIAFGGNTYLASTFNYSPGEMIHGIDGGGTLDIVVTDNTVIDMIETYRSVKLDVVGALVDGVVSELQGFTHTWGSATWDGKKASFAFEKDEKLTMTFPAVIMDASINRGNAGEMAGAGLRRVMR